MSENIFKFNTYVDVLKFKIKEHSSKWGMISKMAEAAGCQRSHLSRVLSGLVHLTPDQANNLSEFWNLNEAESDYFFYLVEHDRAGTKNLRLKIQRKLNKIKQEQEDLSRRLQLPSLGTEEKELLYYSSWHWSAIHILVSIPEHQTVQSISRKLSLPEQQVQLCLEQLEKFGLVKKEHSRWIFSSQTIHLPRKSPLTSLHHNNWRSRASIKSQDPMNDGIHYTVVQSVSHSDYEKIKNLLISTIDEYTRIASPSKEEELVCFACDTFRV